MDVYTSGEWHVKPGREDEFVRAWRALAEASGADFESNTWSFLLRDKQDPRHYRSLAGWRDEQAVRDWREGEAYKRGTEALSGLVEEVDISMFESVVTVGAVPQTMAASPARR